MVNTDSSFFLLPHLQACILLSQVKVHFLSSVAADLERPWREARLAAVPVCLLLGRQLARQLQAHGAFSLDRKKQELGHTVLAYVTALAFVLAPTMSEPLPDDTALRQLYGDDAPVYRDARASSLLETWQGLFDVFFLSSPITADVQLGQRFSAETKRTLLALLWPLVGQQLAALGDGDAAVSEDAISAVSDLVIQVYQPSKKVRAEHFRAEESQHTK